MSGVHGLKHVERLTTATFTNDYAVGPHTQGVDHQLADGYPALALDIRGPGLERNHMCLLELQLGSIFDRHNSFVFGDESAENVERCGLSRGSTTTNGDVE